VGRQIGGGGYPSAKRRIWLHRPVWYSQLFLPLLGVAGLAGAILGVVVGSPLSTGRRTVGVVALALAFVAAWGYLGTRRLVVRRLNLAFPDLPGDLDGLRIAQISDLHAGPHTSRRHLARITEAIAAADPDLLVLTGDQVDDF